MRAEAERGVIQTDRAFAAGAGAFGCPPRSGVTTHLIAAHDTALSLGTRRSLQTLLERDDRMREIGMHPALAGAAHRHVVARTRHVLNTCSCEVRAIGSGSWSDCSMAQRVAIEFETCGGQCRCAVWLRPASVRRVRAMLHGLLGKLGRVLACAGLCVGRGGVLVDEVRARQGPLNRRQVAERSATL